MIALLISIKKLNYLIEKERQNQWAFIYWLQKYVQCIEPVYKNKCANLTQIRFICEERISLEKFPPSDLPVSKSMDIFLIKYLK